MPAPLRWIIALLFSAIFLFRSQCFSQITVRNYNISVAGISLGKIKAEHHHTDSLDQFYVDSHVNFWFFVRVKVEYRVKAVYQNNQLVSSEVTTHSTKGDFSSSTIWNQDHYVVKVDTYGYKLDTVIYSPIHLNMARIYFDEPQQSQLLLADNFGELTKAEPKEKGYRVMINGHPNYLYFRDRKLVRAVMNNGIIDYVFTLVE